MNEMHFVGGPLDGSRYVLLDGVWRWSGDGNQNAFEWDGEACAMIPTAVDAASLSASWVCWTTRGKVEVSAVVKNGEATFTVRLPDGREGTGPSPKEAADAASKEV